MKSILAVLFSFFIVFLNAQISFSDKSDLLKNQDFHSGIAVGVADMNGDGKDDIVRLNDGKELNFEIQTPACGLFLNYGVNQQITTNSFWNIAIGDIDNDGQNDCMMSGLNGSVKVVRPQGGLDDFLVEDIPNSNFFAQGANFVDIDLDGMLDAFICDDDAVSKIYMNEGDGTFSFAQIIDLTTAAPSDNSGNYGSLWTDFDSDGDLDLYIAKCRQGVGSSTDPRRINMLFTNNGDGSYTENGLKFNLALGAQSWTADFGDIDNDGDFDCFITNHDVPSMLMENLGDTTFQDIALEANANISGGLLQGVLADFDNNGFLDILTSGPSYKLMLNNGDKTFTDAGQVIGGEDIGTFSLGDLNHDGFMDIYAVYQDGINGPSLRNDKLWLNEANENHWVKFNLEGTISNRNAIGAKVEIFGDWGKQTREVRSGESYGISTSHIIHFGVGEEEVIDSVIIHWPGELISTHYDLVVDQQYFVQEEGCLTETIELESDCIVICQSDTIFVSAPEGYSEYEWSDGSTDRAIQISKSGVYHVRMTDELGCAYLSTSFSVELEPTVADKSIQLDNAKTICEGEIVTLTAPFSPQFHWNTGDTTQAISISESGQYFAELLGYCDEIMTDTIQLNFVSTENILIENDTILEGEKGTLVSSTEMTRWYNEFTGGLPLFEGDTFRTPELQTSEIYYAEAFEAVEVGIVANVGQESHTGNSFYNSAQFNGALIFDVEQDLIIEEVTVNTEFAGKRLVEIFNANDQMVFKSDTFDIESGTTTITLNAQLQAGEDYYMTTNEELNNLEFSENSPKLWRSDRNFIYPFQIENLIQIKDSNFGQPFYYYFYNWKVSQEPLECVGERVEAKVVIKESVGVEVLELDQIATIFPNPAAEILHIRFTNNDIQQFEITISDIKGKVLFLDKSYNQSTSQIDISNFSLGMYIITIEYDGEQHSGKFLKM